MEKMILDGGMNTLTALIQRSLKKSMEPGIILMVRDICLKTKLEKAFRWQMVLFRSFRSHGHGIRKKINGNVTSDGRAVLVGQPQDKLYHLKKRNGAMSSRTFRSRSPVYVARMAVTFAGKPGRLCITWWSHHNRNQIKHERLSKI